jgi:hypothetical protein
MPHRAYGAYATGARPHVPSALDYQMERLPGVVAVSAPPPSYDLMGYEEGTYDQGAIPCCVLASIALMKSLFDAIDRDRWEWFDFLAAYHAVGGNDHEGVETRTALQYAQEVGLQVTGKAERHRIGSYAFAPRDSPENFASTLKRALWAKHPFVIACRLPAEFGWISSGPRTPAYHQMVGIGYNREGNLIVANSWPNWGYRGFGQLSWEYLVADGFQGGDCYAWTATDCLTDSLAAPT